MSYYVGASPGQNPRGSACDRRAPVAIYATLPMTHDPDSGRPRALMPIQAPPVGAPRRPGTEEELEELPPLDGDDSEPDSLAPAEIDESPPTAGDPFDDSTGEDAAVDPADVEALAREASWVDEPPDAMDLPLGDTGLSEFEESRGAADDGDEPAIAADDIAFGESPDRVSLDAGDEGPLDADDELREED